MINVSIDTGLVISFIMLGWLLNIGSSPPADKEERK